MSLVVLCWPLKENKLNFINGLGNRENKERKIEQNLQRLLESDFVRGAHNIQVTNITVGIRYSKIWRLSMHSISEVFLSLAIYSDRSRKCPNVNSHERKSPSRSHNMIWIRICNFGSFCREKEKKNYRKTETFKGFLIKMFFIV